MANAVDQAINAPKVLLIGASSQIGVFAIQRLLGAGFRVIAVSRMGAPKDFPVLDQLEWVDETGAAQASQSCRHLLSAGPLELARKFLKTGHQFQSAVVFSSSSVESKLTSDSPSERRQMQGMLATESALQASAAQTGVKLVILRPTLIYGCGLDTNISRLAKWIRRFGFVPINGRANGLRQPVHADDLALVAITAMISKDDLPGVFTLAGGETISYAQMVTRVFIALGRPVRLLRLPQWLFLFLLGLAKIFKMGEGINREMVKRQAVDLVFDDRLARELLNYKPREFAPEEKDFTLPDL